MLKLGAILPHHSIGKTTILPSQNYRPIPQSSLTSQHHTPIRIQPRIANC